MFMGKIKTRPLQK